MSPTDAQKLLSNAVISHAAGMAACGVNTKSLELFSPTPWAVEIHMQGKPIYRVTLTMGADAVTCLREEILIEVKPIPGFEMWFPR